MKSIRKNKSKVRVIALVAPSLLAGLPQKGTAGSSCGSGSSGGRDTLTDVSQATGGQPGVFGATATVSAPPSSSTPTNAPNIPQLFEQLNANLARVQQQIERAVQEVHGATNPQDQLRANRALDALRRQLQQIQNRIGEANAQYE